MNSIINTKAIANKDSWIKQIRQLSGNFGDNTNQLELSLAKEIKTQGPEVLIDHLRLCGDIPESFEHSSSEEKLYSKYTDILLCESFKRIGLESRVIKERGDSADVETQSKNYSFIADAKVFRLSRTAKNQKDFKISAMDTWKRGKPYAMVICPIYQLPNKKSQIYEQAISKHVCIFTYSHLAVLINFSLLEGKTAAIALLHKILQVTEQLKPTKDATTYWRHINNEMQSFSKKIAPLWATERQASLESLVLARDGALDYLAKNRRKIMTMSRSEAVAERIRIQNIESRIEEVSGVSDNGLFEIK